MSDPLDIERFLSLNVCCRLFLRSVSLTALCASCPGKVRGGLVVGVMFFGTASPGSLFLAFRYEAVAAAACEVAFREVELETAAHLSLNIINLSISEKICALRISYDVNPVLVLDHIAIASLVQLQTELVSR